MIIGTAGHIDHGKTALVRRLTGIDTDRLPEEKQREMTIDLGYAHLDLEGIGRVGVVDVPGHERFIRNMVAGASGIDLVLFVIAADDGVMPQTREHLEIIRLLGIGRGVIALNKTDLVDTARLESVTGEIRAVTRATPLQDAPVVPVSAQTGAGLDALRQALIRALRDLHPRDTTGFFRLPVDRAFVMHGFGTVVTGTVISGRVDKGDPLKLLPGGQDVRVRGVQIHGQAVDGAVAGNRCALNVTGVEKESLHRGVVLCDPRLERAAHTVDAAVTLVRNLRRPPRNHLRVRFHSGASEVFARLVWLEGTAPELSGDHLAQLRLERETPVLYGDRFVLRGESARQTLGGGVVLDPFARRRGAGSVARIERLNRLRRLDPEEALDVWLTARAAEGWTLPELAEQLAMTPEQLQDRLVKRQDIWRVDSGGVAWVALKQAAESLLPQLMDALNDYLRDHPKATAMPSATLHARACPRLDQRIFRALVDRLATAGKLEIISDGLRPAGHRQRFSPEELALAGRVEAALAYRDKPPPKVEALAKQLSFPPGQMQRFLGELERAGRVAQVARGIYVTRRDLDAWQERILKCLNRQGGCSLAQLRDAIGTGRELAVNVLEYLDRAGVTRREGNVRVAAAGRKESA